MICIVVAFIEAGIGTFGGGVGLTDKGVAFVDVGVPIPPGTKLISFPSHML